MECRKYISQKMPFLFSKKVKLLKLKNVQRPVQFCVKTCHDEYSDKLILHSKRTVNCQQRVELHLCITHQIKENGQLIHAFHCVHLIPILIPISKHI